MSQRAQRNSVLPVVTEFMEANPDIEAREAADTLAAEHGFQVNTALQYIYGWMKANGRKPSAKRGRKASIKPVVAEFLASNKAIKAKDAAEQLAAEHGFNESTVLLYVYTLRKEQPNLTVITGPLDIDCPECGVKAGDRCVTSTGKQAKAPHAARVQAAAQAAE